MMVFGDRGSLQTGSRGEGRGKRVWVMLLSSSCLRSHRRVISVLLNQKSLTSGEREVRLSHFSSGSHGLMAPAGFWVVGVLVGACFSVWSLDQVGRGSQAHRDGRAKAGFCFSWGSKEASPLWG